MTLELSKSPVFKPLVGNFRSQICQGVLTN